MWLSLLLCALCVTAQAPDFDARAALAAAVDRPTPSERQAAARELAARKDVDLADWALVCAGFGSFEPAEPGLVALEVELSVEGSPEANELFVVVPTGYDPAEPAPLLLALHGTGGSGRDEAARWRGLADQLGMLVLAPTDASASQGYAFTPRERARALAALRWVRRHYNVDERRIACTGISRGGHLTWDLALRNPGRFSAIAPMIGGPRLGLQRGQNNLRYTPNVAALAIRDLQGAKDDPLMIFNLRLVFERLEALEARDAELIEFPELGHAFELDAVDWADFFGAARSPAWPSELRLASADLADPGHAWLSIEKLERDIEVEFPVKADKRWSHMSDAEQRRFIDAATDKHTALLEAEWTAPGRLTVKGDGASGLRILVDGDHLGPKGRVRVKFKGRTTSVRPEPTAEVLLGEFVESFDRGFLPTAEVAVP